MQLMQQFQSEAEPKNFQEDALLSRKIRTALDVQAVSYQVTLDAHPRLAATLLLRSRLPLARLLPSYWTFTAGEHLDIRVELAAEADCHAPEAAAPKVAALLKAINAASLGVYFLHKDSQKVICFRLRLPFETSRRHLSSSVREAFLEVSQQFGRFAVAAGLVEAGPEEGAPRQIEETLQRLRELKEEFEFSRQQRKRSTNCYNLANSHVKLVSQALGLIGLCFGRLKLYAREGRVDIARCHRLYGSLRRAVEEAAAREGERAGSFIVRGIEIEKVFREEVIDEGGFSKIHRGVYKFSEVLTCSNNLERPLPPPHLSSIEKKLRDESAEVIEQVEEAAKRILVRKLPKNSEDLSYFNELRVLKFMRNQKSPHIADYYLSCSLVNPDFNNGIYMQYYQDSLARSCHLYHQRELLRISRQILHAVHFLWLNRLLHRDLKELNVLIDQTGSARLIDFGSASGFHDNAIGQFTAPSNRLMATKGYFHSYNDIAVPGVAAKFTREEFNQAETFDMYSFGQILANLFALEQAKDGFVERELLFLAMKCREVNPDDRLRPIEALCYLREVIALFMQESSLQEDEGWAGGKDKSTLAASQ